MIDMPDFVRLIHFLLTVYISLVEYYYIYVYDNVLHFPNSNVQKERVH